MSNVYIIAKRYAKALWDFTPKENTAEVSSKLAELSAIVGSDLELKTLAKSPIFSSEEKIKVFSQIFERLSFSKDLTAFLKLFIEKDRLSLLAELNEEFNLLFLNSEKTKEAVIETAFDLSDAEQKSITQVLEAVLDTKVNVEIKTNESLVAGVIINVDGRRIDASLESNLKSLKEGLLVSEV